MTLQLSRGGSKEDFGDVPPLDIQLSHLLFSSDLPDPSVWKRTSPKPNKAHGKEISASPTGCDERLVV